MVVTASHHLCFLEYLHGPERPVLVFDGATGTSLKGLGLTADDRWSRPGRLQRNLAVTKPDAVKAVHRHSLVGCDVIETDTFEAASIVLAGLDLEAFELNKRAAELAQEMADEFSTPEKPRFVAGPWTHPSCHPRPHRFRHDASFVPRAG